MMISCREAARLSSEAIDRPLLFWERASLRFHLLVCETCMRYDANIRFMCDLLSRVDPLERALALAPSASLSPEARERMKQALS